MRTARLLLVGCLDLIGWSAERGMDDVCRHCAATIADPETLRTLAQWFDSPGETKAVACELGGQRHTLGMIIREVADAIEEQAGAGIAESGKPSAADRSTTTAAADTERETARQKANDHRG